MFTKSINIDIFSTLILLLALLNLMLFLICSLGRSENPAPGQLLYASTFDTNNRQWSEMQGAASTQFADSAMYISIDASNRAAYSALEWEFSDVDVRVNVQWLNVPDQDSQIEVKFRYQDPENYYVLKINSRGAYRVELVRSGHPPDILSDWQISPYILTAQNQIDQSFSEGKLVLGANTRKPGLKVGFDNVLVYGPR